MRTEQTRVQELQQQLEQERVLSLRREREEEERREVRHGLKNIHKSILNKMCIYINTEN